MTAGGVTAVIAVRNEAQSISGVLTQIRRSDVSRAVVVCNGCVDESAGHVRSTAEKLQFPVTVLDFPQPLGHDVGRAIGTYAALRETLDLAGVVYVDGDFAGSFGGMLREFLATCAEGRAGIVSISRPIDPRAYASHAAAIEAWARLLSRQTVVPHAALPFLLPMYIRRDVFLKLSPQWLANPGAWFAAAVTTRQKWGVYPHWEMSMTGHRSRGHTHNDAMLKRLLSDCQTAERWLFGGVAPPQDRTLPGLPPRAIHVLKSMAATAQYRLQPGSPPQYLV